MYAILLAIHVIIALALIGLILLQHGKGAQAGASFGSGASQTVFGSQGSGGFLSRATGTLAAIFFLLNLLLAYMVNKANHQEILTNEPPAVQQPVGEPNKSDVPETQ